MNTTIRDDMADIEMALEDIHLDWSVRVSVPPCDGGVETTLSPCVDVSADEAERGMYFARRDAARIMGGFGLECEATGENADGSRWSRWIEG